MIILGINLQNQTKVMRQPARIFRSKNRPINMNIGSSNRRIRGGRQVSRKNNNSRVTAESLDQDLDSYMNTAGSHMMM